MIVEKAQPMESGNSGSGALPDGLGPLRAGDERALAQLFSAQRDRLRRIIAFRLDRRLAGRIDADDILQEAYLDAASRLHHFHGDDLTTFFVWLRLIVMQTLTDVHRRHLGAQIRDVSRERSMNAPLSPQATSVALAARLLGDLTTPSQAAVREETYQQLYEALGTMSEIDQEIIALRHFEELTNSEAAEALGIQQKAASIRYVRAIKRLRDLLIPLGLVEPERRMDP